MKYRFTDFFCVLLVTVAMNAAAAWPERPIRVIVPFAPGGNVDINARAIAPGLTELWGQQILVENRAGAGGMLGGEFVA